MKKIVISILTIILMSVAMIGTAYAAQLQTTIEIVPNVTEVSAGDNVVFSFMIKNVANAQDGEISAISGKVTYDTNFFELVTGSSNTTFTSGGASGEDFNVLHVAKEGEQIAVLTLKVKDNPTGSGIVSFTNLEASDGDMDKVGDEAVAKTADTQIEIKLKSTQPDNPGSDEVAVTGITITPLNGTVKVGQTTTFIAKVTPDNATNQKIAWTSSDEAVATVNENGVVTGIKEGTATIIATSEDGRKTATATITVEADNIPADDPTDQTTPETPDTETPTTDGTTDVAGGSNDTTVADTVIPKAGVNTIILISIVAVLGATIIIYKKNQNLKDIK